MDRVPRCRLLKPFQEGTYQQLLALEKYLNSAKNWIVVDIHYSYVSTSNLLASQCDF